MIAVMVTDRPRPPDDYKARLIRIGSFSHVNIEVNVIASRDTDQQAA